MGEARQRTGNAAGRRWWRGRKAGLLAVGAALLVLLALAGAYRLLLADLPDPAALREPRVGETTKIYDRQGRLLFEWVEAVQGRHSYVTLDRIPLALRQATVATEDASFYTNPGFDLRAILRAVYLNLRHRRIVSGASTITQQVARMLLLSPQERASRSWSRKLREVFLAWRITRRYSKDEILELYLNHSYYGHLAYGVQAAAEAYFGKNVEELDLAECALLAGLPQAPSAYDPLSNPEAARKRQKTVLSLMVKAGLIGEEEAAQAAREALHFSAKPLDIRAPHFVMYVRQLLEERYGLEAVATGGWRIVTTLDLDVQRRAEETIRRHLAALNDPARDGINHNVRNAALVALDPATGQILAMVGSPDYYDRRSDGAVNGALAPRQPGSALKPITYAAALSAGYTPATVILDVRRAYLTKEGDPYVPENYDRRYYGPISLRRALATSSNAAAVSVLNDIGVPALLNLAQRMGIRWSGDLGRFGLALTLGGGEVSLLDLTASYACFAAGGERVAPVAVLSIADRHGRLLYAEGAPRERDQVLDPRVAYLITDILADDKARIPAFGEESVLYIGRPAAAKTGTTTDWRDNWTIGYTPDLVVGVWTGNADNEPMVEVSGIAGAAPIWHDFMLQMHKGTPVRAFPEPEGIVQAEVCPLSGLLPGPHCPQRVLEKFIAGTVPAESCQGHRLYRLDAATGLPATEETPPGRIVERVYYLLPPEAASWAYEVGFPQPPLLEERPRPSPSRPMVEIVHPDANAQYALSRGLPEGAQRIEIVVQWNGAAPPRELTLYLDGELLATWRQPPYRYWWALAPGDHQVTAQAEDAQGQRWSAAPVRFRVEPPRGMPEARNP